METSPHLIAVMDRIKKLYQVHCFKILQKYSITVFDEGYNHTLASWDYLNWSNKDLVKQIPNKISK